MLINKFAFGITTGVLILYLALNIVASASISPVYFHLVNSLQGGSVKKYESVVEFLKSVRTTPVFTEELAFYRAQYGTRVQDAVYANDKKRRATIGILEQLLQKNPRSPQVLYRLSLLYTEDGNVKKAQDYLEKAKELDPGIK